MKDMLLVPCQDDTMAAFRSLFVDVQGNRDEAALTAAVAKVRSFSVDAASVMFKAVSILQDRFPNLQCGGGTERMQSGLLYKGHAKRNRE